MVEFASSKEDFLEELRHMKASQERAAAHILPSKVLNGGMVRLVEWMGDDLSIVRNARVSYAAAWRAGKNEGSDARLIKYLLEHKHNTPFETVQFKFEVIAPIFVLRQWHRHRTQSYNELSARYREMEESYFLPDRHTIGTQSGKSKQAREIFVTNAEEMHKRSEEINEVENHHSSAFSLYRKLLKEGWPRELARTVLPVATYSHMFVTVDLHNLFGFLSERVAWDAQYEIRSYATEVLDMAELIAPVAVGAWRDLAFRWVPTDKLVQVAPPTGPANEHQTYQLWRQPITGLAKWREAEVIQKQFGGWNPLVASTEVP